MADRERSGPDQIGDGCRDGSRWRWYSGLLICFVAFALLQGCAINRETASVTPNQDVMALKKFYVVKFGPDQRGINVLIADELRRKGFEATTGLEIDAPKNVNAIVTYRDKWQWDITMYMIELTVFVREPVSENLLATGNSYHTSLTRQTPEEMVAEVLTNIFARASKTP